MRKNDIYEPKRGNRPHMVYQSIHPEVTEKNFQLPK